MSVEFDRKIHDTLADANLQLAIYTATGRLKEKRIEVTADNALPDYQELRTQANALKKHAIDNLDHYLEEFERNVEAYGGKVVYCKDATEVSDFVLDLAKRRGSKLIVKSKSMTTEEVDLNERLEHHGLESVETDLGEYILQLAIYTATGRLKEKRIEVTADSALPDYQELRTQANALKKHAIDNLDHYLEEFERNVEAYGGKVVYCKDATEVSDFVLDLAKRRGSKLIVKSKSMTTEEVDLNERLEHHGLESVETDLGEYILQLAHEKPYHIVAPALHKTRYDVADIFTKELKVERETVPEKLTVIARAVLREKFLKADIGISGANFLIADSGAVAIIENEGNARLTTSAPKIHIAVAGIEKVIPRAQDLAVFLKLLARSATGQLLSVYTSFLAGPRRAGEVDGPEEFYVVLLDNGRTKLLPDRSKRQSLYCIRCGACLNTCPVYRKIGGHSFPWVYSGPIGAIITPQFMGVSHEPGLPFASSLCGACGEVCPVKIDIPKVLLELRSDVKKSETREGLNRIEKLAFRAFAWVMTHPRIYEMAGRMAASIAPVSDGKWIRSVPAPMSVGPMKAWLSERDLPPSPSKSFREMWRTR